MENIQRKLEKDLTRRPIRGTSRRTGPWTVLLIRNDGRTIAVKKFKGLIVSLAVVMLLILLGAGMFYAFYRNAREDVMRVRKTLDVVTAEAGALRHRNDVLTARLTLLQSKLEKMIGDTEEDQRGLQGKNPYVETPPPETVVAEVKTQQETADTGNTVPVAPSAPQTLEAEPRVAVETPSIRSDPETGALKVQFIIRKKDKAVESISGRTFAVLKDNQSDPDKWVSLPSVTLKNGKPSRANRGQFFSIARFKPINLEMKNSRGSHRYRFATIFVFSTDGDPLLEQTFPVTVSGSE